jgi:hypothetical protein
MYLGIFLDDMSVTRLKSLVPPRTGDGIQYHHVTLQFKPPAALLSESQPFWGQETRIKVVEIVADALCSVARVVLDNFKEFAPPSKALHITCSHSPAVKPAYANELLGKALSDPTIRVEKASLTLTGRLGYFERGKVRYE